MIFTCYKSKWDEDVDSINSMSFSIGLYISYTSSNNAIAQISFNTNYSLWDRKYFSANFNENEVRIVS